MHLQISTPKLFDIVEAGTQRNLFPVPVITSSFGNAGCMAMDRINTSASGLFIMILSYVAVACLAWSSNRVSASS